MKLPESLGLVVQRGDDEARICVWTGGWADVDVAIGDEASALCPEFEDVDGAHAAVVSVVEDFRRRVLGGMTSGAEGG